MEFAEAHAEQIAIGKRPVLTFVMEGKTSGGWSTDQKLRKEVVPKPVARHPHGLLSDGEEVEEMNKFSSRDDFSINLPSSELTTVEYRLPGDER